MSRVIFNSHLTPPGDQPAEFWDEPIYADRVGPLIRYPAANQDLKIHDPKAFRSMSRSSLMLAQSCLGIGEVLNPLLAHSVFDVGIFCAVENGPIDAPSTAQIAEVPPSEFASTYRKLRNPRMYLKQLPNVVPAQLSIFLGIQGAMNVYTHSVYGSRQALIDAEYDLQSGVIKAALVCSTHAFDDFLQVKRARVNDARPTAEGCATLLLVADGTFTDWQSRLTRDGDRFYGIAHELVRLSENMALGEIKTKACFADQNLNGGGAIFELQT